MSNNPIFQQFNGLQGQNVNPALYKAQLTNKLNEMRSGGVNPDKIISQGISDGKINQQQVDFAYNIAKNIAKNIFGV
ncbi:MAG: hypothetical protein NC253_05395 [Ruminococcus sp.]|nr:hypothetical protein [Ruminococcus sp.]MCM1381806.1 hypothetical protein [Muribaculaceae bacterium]MCM1478264.1 hypothetical protein [Muribaculaceae bacterium]